MYVTLNEMWPSLPSQPPLRTLITFFQIQVAEVQSWLLQTVKSFRYASLHASSTAFLLWSHIQDHSPHHFLVFGHILVNFGRKIKVDIYLETGESRTHAYSIAVYQQLITLVSACPRLKPQVQHLLFC